MKKKNEEESKSKNQVHLYADHKAPVTRRDFLAAGLMGVSTLALTSGSLALMSPSNVLGAAMCGPTNLLCGNVPFLCLDGAGGMNIAGGNVIVGFGANQHQEEFGHNVISDFRRLGIADNYHPSKSGMINSNFGLKFHSTSGILEGLEEVLAPRIGDTKDLREYVDGLLLCAVTNDDTNGNPSNTMYMAQKVGAKGDLVQLIGTSGSVSGGNSAAPSDQVNLTLKPSALSNFKSSESLLSIGNNIMGSGGLNAFGAGGAGRMKKFMELISRGGASQLSDIRRSPAMAAEVDKFLTRQSGTQGVFDQYSPATLNPMTNAADGTVIAKVYDTPLNAVDQRVANILNLLTKRIAGAATIEIGGCDYHNGTASGGHGSDKMIGRNMGLAIRMAAERNQPIFMHLFTDGGVTGDAAGQVDPDMPARTVWRSDDGVRSAAMMLVFHPNRKRVNVSDNEHSNFLLSGKTRQIGWYRIAGGTAIDSHSLANNVSKLWIGVILNYMATLVDSTDDDKIVYEVGEKFKAQFGSILPPDWKELIRLRSLIAA
jgi:hypothetical protein